MTFCQWRLSQCNVPKRAQFLADDGYRANTQSDYSHPLPVASQVAGPEYSEGHRQIYDALVKRNVNTAEAIVSDHVDQDLKVAVRHLSVLAGPPGLFYYTESDVRTSR